MFGLHCLLHCCGFPGLTHDNIKVVNNAKQEEVIEARFQRSKTYFDGYFQIIGSDTVQRYKQYRQQTLKIHGGNARLFWKRSGTVMNAIKFCDVGGYRFKDVFRNFLNWTMWMIIAATTLLARKRH